MKTLVLAASFRTGRRLIHPGRYFVPSKAMDERTAKEIVSRGIGVYEAQPESRVYPPLPDPIPEPVREVVRKYRRRKKGPAPENKALGGADDTGSALD